MSLPPTGDFPPTADPTLGALRARAAGSPDLLGVLREDQARRWNAGERVFAEAYLGAFPGLPEEDALVLITAEMILRRDRGEIIDLDEYRWRFPQFADDLAVQFELQDLGTPPFSPAWEARPGDTPAYPGAGGPVPWPDVPGYEITGEIDRGGMGVVYAARDVALSREVAVKTPRPDLAGSAHFAAQFDREARLTARLSHPGVPPVHATGRLADGRPFLAMRLIRGRTLAAIHADRPGVRPAPGLLLGAFDQVCQAVGYAHSAGIIHRDLKPANVMVGTFGEVQVMDWGLAKVVASPEPGRLGAEDPDGAAGAPAAGDLTRPGDRKGTPAYMAPEQARGEWDKVDARADVFALGGILCSILTGEPPFQGRTKEEVVRQAAAADLAGAFARLDACGADAELVSLCKRCLAADPADRPGNGKAVADAVAAHRATVEERLWAAERDRAAAEARAAEQRRKRRWQVALLAAIGLLAAGGGAFAWWASGKATRNRETLATLLYGCEEALRTGDVPRAVTLLAEADRRAPDPGGSDHRSRLEGCREDLAILRELAAVDQFRWTPGVVATPDRKAVAARIRTAFGRFGIDPIEVSPHEVAHHVIGSAARDRLVAALDLWLRGERSVRVRDTLQLVDPDAYREAVRNSILAEDVTKGVELAWRPAALDQPPGFATALGEEQMVAPARRRAILEAALRKQPGDLGLLMTLGLSHPINSAFGGRVRNRREEGSIFALEHPVVGRRDNAAERVRWFQAAAAAHPGNPAAHLNLGIALGHQGDTVGAAASYREAARLDPGYARPHFYLGYALMNQGDAAGAIPEFREATRLDPTFGTAWQNLGVSLLERGEFDAALAAVREARRLDPENLYLRVNAGLVLRAKGDKDAALAEFQEVVRLEPGLANGHLNIGLVLCDQREWEPAIRALREAIRLDPEFTEAYARLGLALIEKPRPEAAAAIPILREAIRLDPDGPSAHSNLGLALRMKGETDAAIVALRRVTELAPQDDKAHFNLGLVLGEKRDYNGAIASLREAIRINSRNARAYQELGIDLTETGERAEAEKAFRKAVELDPKDAGAHYNLGRLLRKVGDLDGALAAFRESTKLRPGYVDAHFLLGRTLHEKADLGGAAAAFEEVVRLNPRDAEAHENLARVYFEQKRYPEAASSARRTIALEPQAAIAHAALGLSLAQVGDVTGAREALTEAARLSPKEFGQLLRQLPPVPVAPTPREARLWWVR